MKFIFALLCLITLVVATYPTPNQMYDNTKLRLYVPKNNLIGVYIYVPYDAYYLSSPNLALYVGVDFVYSSLLDTRKITLSYSTYSDPTPSEVVFGKTFDSSSSTVLPINTVFSDTYGYNVYLWLNASCDLSVLSTCETITTDLSLYFVNTDTSNTPIYSPISGALHYPQMIDGYSTVDYQSVKLQYNYFDYLSDYTGFLPVHMTSSLLSTFTNIDVLGSTTIYPTDTDGAYDWLQNAALKNHSFVYGQTTHIGVYATSAITGTYDFAICVGCSVSSTVVISAFLFIVSLLLNLF